MKKILMAILTLGSTTHLIAEMRYNPITNLYYSYPEVGVNQAEYRALLIDCATIETRLKVMNGGILPPAITIKGQCIFF